MHDGKYTALSKEYAVLALSSDVAPSGEPWVPAFESSFKEFVGANHAIAVSSGTAGLHSALLALGVGPGDEVITPGLTVVMDSNAIEYCGATPVFVDVDLNTWNLDLSAVESAITTRTRGIVAVSWFGLSAELGALRKIADRYKLFLLDDSAETLFSTQDQPKDFCSPHIRVYSFESKKHFSTGGEGGMVTTDSADLATEIRKFSGLGYRHLTADAGRTSFASTEFQRREHLRFDRRGYNYRLTPLQAAVGLGQMEGISNFLNARLRAASRLAVALRHPRLKPQDVPDGAKHSFYTYGVRLLDGTSESRLTWDSFYDESRARGADGFYANSCVPYLEPVNRGRTFGSQKLVPGLCPNSELLQSQIMAFKTNYLDADLLEASATKYEEALRVLDE